MKTRARVFFRKQGELRFTGHRDLVRTFERALRRSGLGKQPAESDRSRTATRAAPINAGDRWALHRRGECGWYAMVSLPHAAPDRVHRNIAPTWAMRYEVLHSCPHFFLWEKK